MSSIGMWPAGTSAIASSTHAANYAIQCSCNRTYDAFNVLDGDNATFWNDDTSYVWPDTISLALPASSDVNLRGLSILSSIDGFITDFNVSVLHGQTWTTTHQIHNASEIETDLSFFGLSVANSNGVLENVLGLTITVLDSQNEYSRIAEIRPVYDTSASSSSIAVSTPARTDVPTSTGSSTATTSTGSSAATTTTAASQLHSGSQSQKGLIIGLSVMAVIIALVFAGCTYWMCVTKPKRRQRNAFGGEPVISDFKRPETEKQPSMLTHETQAPPEHNTELPQFQPQRPIELPVASQNGDHGRHLASYHMMPQELHG